MRSRLVCVRCIAYPTELPAEMLDLTDSHTDSHTVAAIAATAG